MTDLSPAYHYQVIARALEVIDDAGPALTLEALAQRMNMSPAHFQRVFSQWVGVSPKRYQQYLTLATQGGCWRTGTRFWARRWSRDCRAPDGCTICS